MMRIRNVVRLGLVTTAVALGIVSTAAAGSVTLLYGTRNDALGGHIFKITTDGVTYTPSVYDEGSTDLFFDSLIFENSTSIVYTADKEDKTGSIWRVGTNGLGNTQIATGFNEIKDLVLEPTGANCASLSGCVIVSEAGAGRLTRVRLDTGAVSVIKDYAFSPDNDGPQGLAFDLAGNLFVNIGFRGNNTSEVARISPFDGSILDKSNFGPGTDAGLDGLTFDSFNGPLYATSVTLGAQKIYEFPNLADLTVHNALFAGQFDSTFPDGVTTDSTFLYTAGFVGTAAGELWKCDLGGSTCTSIRSIAGIDDLAPFDQSNPTVPEPGSLVLFGTGLLALVGYRRRRSR